MNSSSISAQVFLCTFGPFNQTGFIPSSKAMKLKFELTKEMAVGKTTHS